MTIVCSVALGACAMPEDEADGALSPSAGKADDPFGEAWQMTEEEILQTAHAVSERCREEPCLGDRRIGYEEMQVLFKAAEIETGISARLMKAIAFGEALATGYPDKWPRHFYDTEVQPAFEYKARWAWFLLRIDLPIVMGDDRSFGNQTYGLGISQLTADISKIKKSLIEYQDSLDGGTSCGELRYQWQEDWDLPERTCYVVAHGGGRPGYWYNDNFSFHVHWALHDPYYNILSMAEFLRFKQEIYGLPERPTGPLDYISMDPDSEEDPDMAWALLGSTYQTYGGYGPGGGATERIYNRMTNPDWDSWSFADDGPIVVDGP